MKKGNTFWVCTLLLAGCLDGELDNDVIGKKQCLDTFQAEALVLVDCEETVTSWCGDNSDNEDCKKFLSSSDAGADASDAAEDTDTKVNNDKCQKHSDCPTPSNPCKKAACGKDVKSGNMVCTEVGPETCGSDANGDGTADGKAEDADVTEDVGSDADTSDSGSDAKDAGDTEDGGDVAEVKDADDASDGGAVDAADAATADTSMFDAGGHDTDAGSDDDGDAAGDVAEVKDADDASDGGAVDAADAATTDTSMFDADGQTDAGSHDVDAGSVDTSGDTADSGVDTKADTTTPACSTKDCDDKNPCTTDSCDKLKGCVNLANTATCSDANPCTVGDVCADKVCKPGKPNTCDDKLACTVDSCDKLKGCVHKTDNSKCDDGKKCTDDTCVVTTGCIHKQKSGCAPCTKATRKKDCDDGNGCTADLCVQSACYHESLDQKPCDDGSKCTQSDVCKDKTCAAGKQLDCNDKNACTDDVCDPKTGCTHKNNTNKCEDGSKCTLSDVCKDGKCVPGKKLDCNDKNACTDDACNAKAGCTHKQDDNNTCDDGNKCTSDACVAGKCVSKHIAGCKSVSVTLTVALNTKFQTYMQNNQQGPCNKALRIFIEKCEAKNVYGNKVVIIPSGFYGDYDKDIVKLKEIVYTHPTKAEAWVKGSADCRINISGYLSEVKDALKDYKCWATVNPPKGVNELKPILTTSAGCTYEYSLADTCLPKELGSLIWCNKKPICK